MSETSTLPVEAFHTLNIDFKSDPATILLYTCTPEEVRGNKVPAGEPYHADFKEFFFGQVIPMFRDGLDSLTEVEQATFREDLRHLLNLSPEEPKLSERARHMVVKLIGAAEVMLLDLFPNAEILNPCATDKFYTRCLSLLRGPHPSDN